MLHELQVALHLANRLLVGNRAVPGHDYVHVHRKNAVAGAHPVRDRTGPSNGCSLVEQEIACEDDTILGQQRNRVTTCMRRAELDQPDGLAAHFELELAAESAVRLLELAGAEIEGLERLG